MGFILLVFFCFSCKIVKMQIRGFHLTVTICRKFFTNNNNNCLKSNIQCIEIRVQWTVHLGSSHMHVHAVTRVHAVTPKLVICVMYLTSIWRILLMTDGLNAVWSNDRAAHTDTNPKNLELAPPQSIMATRLDQLVYSPNYYIQIFQTQNNCPQWEANLHPARSESWAFATTPRELTLAFSSCAAHKYPGLKPCWKGVDIYVSVYNPHPQLHGHRCRSCMAKHKCHFTQTDI